MKLLIHTNVILDMVLKRSCCDISMELFRKIKETRTSAYITESFVTDIFYIICKETHDISRIYITMENVFRLVAVLSVTEKDIQDAFGQKWKDFKDCVQYMTGKNSRMAHDRKDYADAMLPVMTPTAWIKIASDMQKNK